MEKRVLLAVILSFVVLYGYQALFPPPKAVPPPAQSAPGVSTPDAAKPQAAPPQAEAPAQTNVAPLPPAPAAAPVVADQSERDVFFENDSVRAVFTTRGGVLKSWELKKYQGTAGQPLELVPQAVPADKPRPFSLAVEDAPTTATLRQALYKPSATAVRVVVGGTPATLAFDYEDAAGLSVHKEFAFAPDQPYNINFTARVTRSGSELVPTIEFGPGIGTGLVASSRTYNPPPQPIFYRDGKVVRVKNTKIEENAVQEGTFGFAGVDDHYFLTAAVPLGLPLHLQYRPLVVPDPGGDEKAAAHFVEWSVRYPAAPQAARFFFGPKDFDVLVASIAISCDRSTSACSPG